MIPLPQTIRSGRPTSLEVGDTNRAGIAMATGTKMRTRIARPTATAMGHPNPNATPKRERIR